MLHPDLDVIGPRLKVQQHQRIGLSRLMVISCIVIMDAAIVSLTGAFAYWLYVHGSEPERLPSYAAAIALMTLAVLQIFTVSGLYRFDVITNPMHRIFKLISLIVSIFLFFLSVAFFLKVTDDFSRVWATTWLAAMILLIPVGRAAGTKLLRGLARRDLVGKNIIVYGAGAQAVSIIRHIEAANRPWDRIIAVFDDRKTRTETATMGYPVVGDLNDLLDWARLNRVDDILVALPWSADARLLQITETLASLPADVRLSPEFVGTDLLHRTISHSYGVPMLDLLTKPVSGWSAFNKQVIDYAVGVIALLLAAPLILAIAIFIKLDSKGPVLFRQPRYGFKNQLFDVFKFRTMYEDLSDVDASQLTLRDDPRVTKVGRLLRRLSLDELPQLFNVLRNEMSVVGPRPHAVEAKAGGRRYEEVVEQYANRHRVKPGITGWAQVNGWRGNTEKEEDLIGRLEHDLYYVDNWSILFDLTIISRTAFVIVRGENSY
jgi:Undecaprenyl-phosphate glucose phosphotransferase